MLEFRNVSVNIGKTLILNNISACFEKGQITTLAGPNGCGKTTLLQTLNSMSKVVDGQIYIDDEDFLKLPLRERAKRLSFMPQIHEKPAGISVRGLIEHGRFPYMGFSRKMGKEDLEAVERAIDFTSLSEYRNTPVNELSGGLQQRAYIAMQLAQNSPYMVLDEPMNYLDFPSQREMNQLIRNLNNDGKTIILVLHNLGQAMQISDSLVVMDERRIVGAGTPMECMGNGILERTFKCRIEKVNIDGTDQYVFL